MTANDLKKNILKDMKVELLDEFDKNFERKGFFATKWKARRREGKGSLLDVRGGGGLRGSLKARITSEAVVFSSGLPYAQIHNEGGDITVTARMKRFFWAKYYELSGNISYRKNGKINYTRKNVRVIMEAEFYKSMALMKLGSKIHIPKRQFIGHAREVDVSVKKVIDRNLNAIETMLKQGLKGK